MPFFVRSLLPGLVIVLFAAIPVQAADEPVGQARSDAGSSVSIEKVEIGFQGLYKVGEWTPLQVTVRSTVDRHVRIVVDTPDPDDNVTSLPGPVVRLPPGTPVHLATCFRTGRMNGELSFEIRDFDGRTLAARRLRATSAAGALNATSGDDGSSDLRLALKLDAPLWVTLGKFDLAGAFADSAASGKQPPGGSPDAAHDTHLARLDSPSQLPVDSRALQSVDLLILPTGRPAKSGDSILSQVAAAQSTLLQNWVRMGGHLLLSVGAETDAFEKSPLADWVPVKIDGQLPLRQLSGFESFSGRNAPLKVTGTIPAARLVSLPRANVVLSDASNPNPLIASVPYGFGRVTIVAVDIDRPPLSNWPALKLVMQKLARSSAAISKSVARKVNRQLTHVGVSDLATQFQSSNENFSGVRRPSYWWIMGLILLYVAVIGPVDYLLVHRLLRRPELTWLTFPILMCLGIAGAAWYADRANGRDLQVNQFDLVDIDLPTGTVRYNTWVSLYSPRHQRFSVDVEPVTRTQLGQPDAAATAVHVSWMGVPENSVGGMYRSGGASFGGREYRFGAESTSVENIPVPHWSTKTLSFLWQGESTQPAVECRLENFGTGQLRGTLTHHFEAPLEDCLVVASGWAYLPVTAGAALQPGAVWALDGGKNVRQRDLRALLTGERQTRFDKKTGAFSTSEVTTTTEAYDPLDRDFDQQVRMISFHDAAGGSDYTGLSHAALRGLEMTDLMQLGRAILIGRLKSSPARIVVDGGPVEPVDHETWVRLVLPIEQAGSMPDKVIPKASETHIPKASEKRDAQP